MTDENNLKEIFSQRLSLLLQEHELKQVDLAKILNVSESSVGKWILKKAIPRMGIIQKIADYFHVPKTYLLEESPSSFLSQIPSGAMRPQFKKVPMLGYAAAGSPLEDLNQDTPLFDINNKYDVDFCITVRGDSMVNAGINDGDIVFIKSMPEVPSGKIACIEIDNEKVCLKRFYKYGETVTLVSENSKYPPLVFTKNNCESLKVLGLAVLRQSEIV